MLGNHAQHQGILCLSFVSQAVVDVYPCFVIPLLPWMCLVCKEGVTRVVRQEGNVLLDLLAPQQAGERSFSGSVW